MYVGSGPLLALFDHHAVGAVVCLGDDLRGRDPGGPEGRAHNRHLAHDPRRHQLALHRAQRPRHIPEVLQAFGAKLDVFRVRAVVPTARRHLLPAVPGPHRRARSARVHSRGETNTHGKYPARGGGTARESLDSFFNRARRYNHFCPWSGIVIGKGNEAYFQVFICSVVVALIYDVVIVAMSLNDMSF